MLQLRILPVVIFVSFLLLSMRVGNIFFTMEEIKNNPGPAITTTSAIAEEIAEPEEKEQEQTKEESATPTEEKEEADLKQLEGADPLTLSDSELNLLQALSSRREELDVRERQLDQRNGLLEAAEQRIDTKISELKTLKHEIETVKTQVAQLVKTVDGNQEQELQRLVKIYESMKPKEAAEIFNQLDMEVLLEVIGKMKEVKTAPILAKMTPDKARTITMEIARHKDLPEFARDLAPLNENAVQ